MKRTSIVLLFVLSPLSPLPAHAADPHVTSWFTAESTHYARVRETDASAAGGASIWTGQTLPAYAGIQEVASDSNYVYVRSHGLAGYVMGPSGVKRSETLDPNLAKHPDGGVPLSLDDKRALIAFLKTLTDGQFSSTRDTLARSP